MSRDGCVCPSRVSLAHVGPLGMAVWPAMPTITHASFFQVRPLPPNPQAGSQASENKKNHLKNKNNHINSKNTYLKKIVVGKLDLHKNEVTRSNPGKVVC